LNVSSFSSQYYMHVSSSSNDAWTYAARRTQVAEQLAQDRVFSRNSAATGVDVAKTIVSSPYVCLYLCLSCQLHMCICVCVCVWREGGRKLTNGRGKKIKISYLPTSVICTSARRTQRCAQVPHGDSATLTRPRRRPQLAYDAVARPAPCARAAAAAGRAHLPTRFVSPPAVLARPMCSRAGEQRTAAHAHDHTTWAVLWQRWGTRAGTSSTGRCRGSRPR